MSELKTYPAEKIFTGNGWLAGHSVVVEKGKVVDMIPNALAVEGIQPLQYMIAPAFIDIQIYGAREKLFSVYQDADSLEKLYSYCMAGGASHFQPTVATNSYEVFYRCIDAVKTYWTRGGKGCIGLHIEGPWIHPQKRGAHIASFIHSPGIEEARELLEYGKGVITMITLAPEVCSKELINLVRSYGVIISAGHSNAGYEEAMSAFDGGIEAATHLYNAMSAFQHRAPGLPGAIFDHATVMSSIVPDGYHVDFAAVRIAKRLMGKRLFAITDAVTQTDKGPYQHQPAGDKYEANGILSGSALTMGKCLQNLVQKAGVDTEEALRMVSLYPAQVMKLTHQLGTIEKGKDANLVFLDNQLRVCGIV